MRLHRDVSRNGHGDDKLLLARLSGPLRHLPTGKAILATEDAVAWENLPPLVRSLVRDLDRLRVPLEHGRDRAGRALTGAGVRWSTDTLSEALRVRKTMSDPLASLPDDLPDPFGQVKP